jgi:NRPS condensation-like uncharacterized protein
MGKIPERFKARTIDKTAICMRTLAEMVLHFEMEFDHSIDAARLEKALDLILDAEPVLGCRFVTDTLRVYWERLPHDRRRNFTLASSREEYDAFLSAEHKPEAEPQFKGCLLKGDGRDRIALKISHESSDAGGLKEASAILARIYNRLLDDPDYIPEPNLKGSRSILQVLRHVPLLALPRIYLNYLITSFRVMMPSKGFGYRIPGGHDGRPRYSTRHISAEKTSRLAEYGRARGATLNDIMMAAFIRTLASSGGWDGASELHSIMTIDLRRWYIPGGTGEAVCNLSTLDFVILGHKLGAGFDDTLALVTRVIRSRKANWYGLNDYIGTMPSICLFPARFSSWFFNRFFGVAAARGSWVNALTNMGPITDEHTMFGKPAARAWLIIPPMFPPLHLVGMTGYAGGLSFSASSFDGPETRAIIENFLDRLIEELPE